MPGARRRETESTSVTLSPTNPDPLASLRIWGTTVTLGGQDFSVPPLPAAKWLEILLAPEPDAEAWFPGLCGPDGELAVWAMMAEGRASQEDLEACVWDVLEEVSGRRWWITLRLCRSIRAHWEWIGGVMALSGLSPFDVSLSYWLDGAYTAMINGIMERSREPRKVADWTRALVTPPAGMASKELDDAANTAAFLAAMRASS